MPGSSRPFAVQLLLSDEISPGTECLGERTNTFLKLPSLALRVSTLSTGTWFGALTFVATVAAERARGEADAPLVDVPDWDLGSAGVVVGSMEKFPAAIHLHVEGSTSKPAVTDSGFVIAYVRLRRSPVEVAH